MNDDDLIVQFVHVPSQAPEQPSQTLLSARNDSEVSRYTMNGVHKRHHIRTFVSAILVSAMTIAVVFRRYQVAKHSTLKPRFVF